MKTMEFSISQFENAFYFMLYNESGLDVQEFNRKICYNGRVMRVKMHLGRIFSVVDTSGPSPVVLYDRPITVSA